MCCTRQLSISSFHIRFDIKWNGKSFPLKRKDAFKASMWSVFIHKVHSIHLHHSITIVSIYNKHHFDDAVVSIGICVRVCEREIVCKTAMAKLKDFQWISASSFQILNKMQVWAEHTAQHCTNARNRISRISYERFAQSRRPIQFIFYFIRNSFLFFCSLSLSRSLRSSFFVSVTFTGCHLAQSCQKKRCYLME